MSQSTTKQTEWPVKPAKTQINLRIHIVWSESSLSGLQIIFQAIGYFTP